ncbi:hypothetical protein [Sporichthya polymorpha]|uniref:hypothetical protein n=1 Tax=Sporichthya polymorpha TaxID=35751 RepID=UPI000364A325|nr:hypothetical protein [Sporichthya polymorpha]
MNLPPTLFGGRVRTSTVGLMAAFVAVLTLWILIRPEPLDYTEEVVTVRKTRATPTPRPEPTVTPVPAATPRPTPAPPRTPRPSGAPRATPTPVPTPAGGVGDLFATPEPTPEPTPTPSPVGLF